jgi:hypothetical protein
LQDTEPEEIAVDDARFDELKDKAEGTVGLSREEADELGKLYAEERGDTYANADDVTLDAEGNELHEGVDDEAVKAEEERGELSDSRRPAETDRPAAPADAGELIAEEGLEDAPSTPTDRPGEEDRATA